MKFPNKNHSTLCLVAAFSRLIHGSLLAVDKIEGGGRAGNSPQAKLKAGRVYMVPYDGGVL